MRINLPCMAFKVENTVWNWRKSRTRNDIFRAQHNIKLNLKCHERENDISEDHWTWPKYPEENVYGKAQLEDSHIVFNKRLFIFLPATNIIHDLQQLNLKLPTHKESESLLDLQKTAADKGFVIDDNLASGNCMFYALSDQLQRVKGINISHEEIRKELVRFLEKFPKLVRPLLRRSLVLNLIKMIEWFKVTRKFRQDIDANLLRWKEHSWFTLNHITELLSFIFLLIVCWIPTNALRSIDW